MAQDTWINVAVSGNASNILDPKGKNYLAAGGTAAASDYTVSYDHTKVPTLAVFDSAYQAARTRAIAGGLK